MTVLVSIYCMTYNHEKYIRNALDGFVNQVTNFDYEVVVHDDASTDSTAAIILEYAEKYPQIIIPVIQNENQYSQGVDIFKTYISPQLHGKYIAECEGDDYWCDNRKLQKQVDFLESHKDYIGCVHDSIVFDQESGEKKLYSRKKKTGLVSMKEIINWRCIYQSATLIYRQGIRETMQLEKVNGIGDYPLALHLRLNGKLYYMKAPMAVYRIGINGSWTNRNPDIIENEKSMITILEMFNKVSNGKYNRLVQKKIGALQIDMCYRNKRLDELKKLGSLKIAYLGYGKLAISIFLQSYCNWLFILLRKVVKKK